MNVTPYQGFRPSVRLGLCLGLLALSLLTACGSGPAEELRIGLVIPLSGELTAFGESTLKAAEFAVQQVNEDGGLRFDGERVRVVLVVEDNADNPEVAVNVANRMINRAGVSALVGPRLSRNAIPVAAVAEAAQIPMISPTSTHPQTTAGKTYVFRATFTDPFQGAVMAEFARTDLEATRAAVLFDVASAYNKGIAEIFRTAFEERGGEVVAFESYVTGETNYEVQLQRIVQVRPDVLVLPNYPPEVVVQLREARRLGLSLPVIAGDALNEVPEDELPALEGLYLTTHWHMDGVDEIGVDFLSAYRELYGEDPSSGAALTYDAFQLLFRAAELQNSTAPKALRDGLLALEGYTGVTGRIEFRGSGDPLKDVVILRVSQGNFLFVRRVEP